MRPWEQSTCDLDRVETGVCAFRADERTQAAAGTERDPVNGRARRSLRVCTALGVALIALAGGCATIDVPPYEIEAKWVDSTAALYPLGADFEFNALRRTRDSGIVAIGDVLVLRIKNETEPPRVMFGFPRRYSGGAFPQLETAADLGPDRLVLLGTPVAAEDLERYLGERGKALYRQSNILGILFDGGRFVDYVAGPPRPTPWEWRFPRATAYGSGRIAVLLKIDFAKPGETLRSPGPRFPADAPPNADRLFTFDGSAWSALPNPQAVGLARREHIVITDICAGSDLTLWAGGFVVRTDEHGYWRERRNYLARFRDDQWTVVTPPDPPVAHVAWHTTHILQCERETAWLKVALFTERACLGDWMCARTTAYAHRIGTEWTYVTSFPNPRVVREDDTLGPYPLLTAGVDAEGALWISYASDHDAGITEPLHRWDGKQWTTFELPRVPGARYYDVEGFAFEDDGTGWAISNLYGGAAYGTSHGILLRFDGNRWRLQNWTYPFWRKRGFGLFG